MRVFYVHVTSGHGAMSLARRRPDALVAAMAPSYCCSIQHLLTYTCMLRSSYFAATRPLLQKAEKPAAAAASAVDPNDPIIAPAAVSWREYKNEYFKKRGYTLAPKDWTVRSFLAAISRSECRLRRRQLSADVLDATCVHDWRL